MRWETTVWLSAVLVVTTTALHLTIEHDQKSPPGLDTSTNQDIVHVISDSDDLVASPANKDEGREKASSELFSHDLIELDSSSSQSETKSESDESFSKSRSQTSETTEEDVETSNSESFRSQSGSGGASDGEQNGSDPPGSENNGSGDEIGEQNTPNPPETDDSGSGNEGDPTATTPRPAGTEDNGSGYEGEPTATTPNPAGTEDNGSGNDDDSAITTLTPSGTGDDVSVHEGTQTTDVSPLPDNAIVETSTGRVHGHVWRENANIISYIDIKYGTFDNRFEAPVFPEKSDYVHDEKDHTKRCPQLQGDKSVGVLDCLTLSIFKPSKDKLSGASVLVHIHEGNFISESANPYIYGPEYLVPQDIILVLPNYRLGPLGFLCLRNETAPGNAALKDLTLALKWVKENIVKFGGDPKNIAVSGEGTAGALAGYLALSPMSKSYVNKVITESGSVLSHWAIDRNPTVTARVLAERITGSWESWQNIDMEVLQLAARNINWRPCLEDETEDGVHFMVKTPWELLKEQKSNATFMIGSAEYAGVHESLTHTEATIQLIDANFSLILPSDLQFETSEKRTQVGDEVKAHYFGEDPITLSDVKTRTLYYTDVAYLNPGIRTARSLINSGSTVYFYEFSFVGKLNRELAAIEKPVDGAVRGDIIGYLFYQEGDIPVQGAEERNMIEKMIQFWSSFLKTGIPKAEDIEWNKFEEACAEQELWLSIGEKTAMIRGVHVERLDFWTDIYNQHFIDNLAVGLSPSVYTVLLLQVVFFISFFKNAWHFF